MSTIHQTLTAALSGVLPNTWAVELPPDPAWPAAVFDVDSEPEAQWCIGGGYTQHDVNLLVFSRDLDELDALLPTGGRGPFIEALESVDGFQYEAESGDADYEPDPEVYGRFLIVRIRTPRY